MRCSACLDHLYRRFMYGTWWSCFSAASRKKKHETKGTRRLDMTKSAPTYFIDMAKGDNGLVGGCDG